MCVEKRPYIGRRIKTHMCARSKMRSKEAKRFATSSMSSQSCRPSMRTYIYKCTPSKMRSKEATSALEKKNETKNKKERGDLVYFVAELC